MGQEEKKCKPSARRSPSLLTALIGTPNFFHQLTDLGQVTNVSETQFAHLQNGDTSIFLLSSLWKLHGLKNMKEPGTWEAPGEHVFSLALLPALVSKISKKQTLCSLLQQKNY